MLPHQHRFGFLILLRLGGHSTCVASKSLISALSGLMFLPVVLAVGCVGHRTFVANEAVGPRPGGPVSGTQSGTLLVFSALQTEATGSDSTYQRHADYWLRSRDAGWRRKVRNQGSGYSSKPVPTELPPGGYQLESPVVRQRLLPQFDHDIAVVEVVIKRGLTTVVYLDGALPDGSVSTGSALVRLTNGVPIGWKASP